MADHKDFFEEPKTVVPETKEEVAPEKISVGEDEYTQEELGKLVGLGKIGQEAEDKFKTDIGKVWPEYTKSRQEVKELTEKLTELESQKIEEKAVKGVQLSPEEIKKQAIAQANELGLIHQGNLNQAVASILEGRDLIEQTKNVIKENTEDGKPNTEVDTLLKHMEETGIKIPEKAYKDMFETEIDKWKMDKLNQSKPQGLVTESTSTAGSKQPEPVKVTKQNLQSLIEQSLRGGGV